MKIRILIISIFIVFELIGCSATKQIKKTKQETTTEKQNDIVTEKTTVTEEKREGGHIATEIIPEEYRERDESGAIKELVQTIRDGGLTKTIIYKQDGGVDVDCTADEIWTRIEERLNQRDLSITETETKESTKEKEEKFKLSDTIILSIMGAIVILGSIVILLMFKKINSQSEAFKLVLDGLNK